MGLRNFVVPLKEVMASSKQSHSAVRIKSNPVSQAISKRFKTLQKYLPSPQTSLFRTANASGSRSTCEELKFPAVRLGYVTEVEDLGKRREGTRQRKYIIFQTCMGKSQHSTPSARESESESESVSR